MEEYRTVLREGVNEFTEKRSRFIGHIMPVATEAEALSFISRIKSKYWDAKHNVYAYILRENNICRFSDDGEPKGTAGVPVLDALQKEGLTDCAVVVTRYFGGVLLGAGGLVRAYSHGAKIAVDAGGIAVMRRCAVCRISCDYSRYSRAEILLDSSCCSLINTDFGADIAITFALPEIEISDFEIKLSDAFCGDVILEITGYEFRPFPV